MFQLQLVSNAYDDYDRQQKDTHKSKNTLI